MAHLLYYVKNGVEGKHTGIINETQSKLVV